MINRIDNCAYIATEETINIVLGGKYRTVQIKSKEHKKEVMLALERFKKSGQNEFDLEELEIYLAPIRRAVLAADNRFELSPDGKVLYLVGSTVPLPTPLSDRIIDFLDNGLPIDALAKFWESCLKNPHYVAVQELFAFLEENKLPLTEDGGFLGYKKLNFVRGANRIDVPDEFEELTINANGTVVSITGGAVLPSIAKKYKEFIETSSHPIMVDVYSGTIRQKIGDVVKIERIRLNEEARRDECGYGLHIGAFSYGFPGNVRVLCKIFPADVIACNEGQAKLRTCAYQIVSFVDEAREVREMFCNLQGDEARIASGEFVNDEESNECPFGINEQVIFDGPADAYYDEDENEYELTEGESYCVIDTDGDEILIVNNMGDSEWYPVSDFSEIGK
jgi:hypothetical protein